LLRPTLWLGCTGLCYSTSNFFGVISLFFPASIKLVCWSVLSLRDAEQHGGVVTCRGLEVARVGARNRSFNKVRGTRGAV
jgi:hypothetical protein